MGELWQSATRSDGILWEALRSTIREKLEACKRKKKENDLITLRPKRDLWERLISLGITPKYQASETLLRQWLGGKVCSCDAMGSSGEWT